ncbi:MAG: hypothetical protein M1818_003537 [Claussenomyces sp. TS43310]|nr:MAG: hypothetical protein M1818_003537 [Claussenomyces sp. TS43310]
MARGAEALKVADPELRILEIPDFGVLINTHVKPYPYTKTYEEAEHDRVCILHTSGSTGTPKPISYSNAFCATIDTQRFYPAVNGQRVAGVMGYGKPGYKFYLSFPMFHLAGFAISLVSIFYGSIIVLGPTDVPPNGRVVSDVMRHTDVQALIAPPSIFEDVVKEYREEFVEYAKKLERILFGGEQVIGSTEAGLIANMVVDQEDWQWFAFHSTHSGVEMDPVEGSDLYEMVIRPDPRLSSFQPISVTFPGTAEWWTKDLFQKHPTKNLWLYRGRKDDVLVLSNGEKFNPVSMEGIVAGHPKVTGALVVGARRPQCALLIESSEVKNSERLISEIWPTVEEANKVSPSHAHISRELVMVLEGDKRFPRAAKGTVMRHAATKEFAEDIDTLYDNVDQTAADINWPELSSNDLASVQRFIHELLSIIWTDGAFRDSDDLYVGGLDSLQTIQLVGNLKAALKVPADETRFGPRLIYEHPTVEKLAGAIQHIINPTSSVNGNASNGEAIRVARMEAMLEKMVKDLPRNVEGSPVAADEPLTVLLTGSTGSLGSYCLETMLRDPKVKKIYCLNRSADAREKFYSRIEDSVLKSHQSKAEFFQSSFGAPALGLAPEVYDRALAEVDVIIHNAWKVNFNHSLESFEEDHLRGLRNLIDLSLHSPRQPSLNFVSSVSTMGNWGALYPNQLVPERPTSDDEWRAALPMGYGESKLVGERMLRSATQAGIRGNVLRVGQISGPVKRGKVGVWNHQEWFPSLVKSTKSLKAVPSDLGSANLIDWIPVDFLADVIVDLVHSTASAPAGNLNVFNLVNPQRVGFETLVPTIAQALATDETKVIPLGEWLGRLEELDAGDQEVVAKVPALKIKDFYFGFLNSPGEGEFATDAARKESKTMAGLRPVSGKDVEIWLEQWGY